MALSFGDWIPDSEPEIEWDNSALPQLEYRPSSPANTSHGIPSLATDSSSESENSTSRPETAPGTGPEYSEASPCPTPNLEEKYHTAGEEEDTDDELYLPPLRIGSFRGTMASTQFNCDKDLADALAKIRAINTSEESSS
jgi:hypothetical protein